VPNKESLGIAAADSYWLDALPVASQWRQSADGKIPQSVDCWKNWPVKLILELGATLPTLIR